MTRLISLLLSVALSTFALPAGALLRIVATTPDLASVARAIGGPHVNVSALALHSQDPHWVDAKPSLALELSRANMLLLTGADLEAAWLQTLLVGSRNADIQKGARGHLDCSGLVDLLEVPTGKVDRSHGDVHPFGNPHYMLDPRAVERVAVGIGKHMASLDPGHKQAYWDGTKRFLEALRAARAKWEKRLSRLRGTEVVAYHKSLSYLASWLGFTVIEHLEPRPGIPPNPRHVAHVVQVARQRGVRVVLQEAWFPSSTSRVVADKCSARLVVLAGQPNFSAGESFITFFENNVKRLERGFGQLIGIGSRAAMNPLLRCRSLEVGHRGRAVLPKIDLSIETGELWAIIGRNGSGKTTWLRTVLGLLPPVSGTIERAPDTRLSYLPQRSSLDELYPLLAREVVRMGTLRGWSFLGPRLGGESPEVERALAEMNVADLADRPFRQLSEGQKQRVLFARVAASDAQLALLDEPTSAMDAVAEREAFALLDGLRKSRPTAIIVVSHYLGLVREFADRALLFDRDTPAVVAGTPEEVFRHRAFAARYGDSVPPASHA